MADCAVIAIPDDAAGEVPKAIVVKSASAGSDEAAAEAIKKHVQDHKARHKWLKGGIRFVDAIPKNPSGKILRRLRVTRRRRPGERLPLRSKWFRFPSPEGLWRCIYFNSCQDLGESIYS